VESSSFKGDVVETTRGITPITAEHHHHHHHHDHENADPHAWQSIKNVIIYANNIATAFAAKDPANKAYYGERLKDYTRRLKEKDIWAKAEIAKIPLQKRSVVVPHNSFAYFASDYGIQFIAPQGLSTEDEASAQSIAAIIDALKGKKASAIFTENIMPSPIIKQLAEETKLPIGGQLFSDALSTKDGKAYTYMEFFTANVDALTKALNK
jgi:zinc/manganese transport system substrate-binding protein